MEIDRLRNILLNPYGKKRHHGTNVYMREKPKAHEPPQVFITIDMDEGLLRNGGQ
jgi:hypothetical protein